MDINDLIVYKSPFQKQRIGKNNDGGYVILDIPNVKYSILLSGGIENDISFEENFIKKYQNIECIAFDGTIAGLPANNSSIKFVKKNIGFENTNTVTNLHDIIDSHENIFIKMDIEGGEIPWLKSLNNAQMNKFEQIVIEFHTPFSEKEANTFKIINNTHILVHFHGNNSSGTRRYNNVMVPNVFECTYLHKKYFIDSPSFNTDLIPSQFDMPNIPYLKDLKLNYFPFVSSVSTTNDVVRLMYDVKLHKFVRCVA